MTSDLLRSQVCRCSEEILDTPRRGNSHDRKSVGIQRQSSTHARASAANARVQAMSGLRRRDTATE